MEGFLWRRADCAGRCLKLADWPAGGAAAVAAVVFPSRSPRPAKCKIRRPLVHGSWLLAPGSMACCLLLAIVSGHLHRNSLSPSLPSSADLPISAPNSGLLPVSWFEPPSSPLSPPRPGPQAPQPPAPARPSARRQHRRSFLSFVDLPVHRPSSFVRYNHSLHCSRSTAHESPVPTQHTHSSPDLQCCCPGSRRSSHLQ